ncbi:MAG: PGPGW domain-containing protein, partial [Dermatophilus congolensis]|nr:PGPGW domain-containing protein [Dermatophilus congolensis]
GPGWLVVFIGISILASEFHWARRLHNWGWVKVQAWTTWIMAQPFWVRGAVATATFLFVSGVVWCTLKLTGLPGWLPAQVAQPMHQYLFL